MTRKKFKKMAEEALRYTNFEISLLANGDKMKEEDLRLAVYAYVDHLYTINGEKDGFKPYADMVGIIRA